MDITKDKRLPEGTVISETFKCQDIICSIVNYKQDLLFWFIANSEDVRDYSDIGRKYLIHPSSQESGNKDAILLEIYRQLTPKDY